jgi:hypothetical protein
MTHRILNALRSLALYGAVTLGLRKAQLSVSHPAARYSGAAPEDLLDSWMFDRPAGEVSCEAYLLDQEYGRVSGALAGLRAVLSRINRMPLAAAADAPCLKSASVSFDPALFDEVPAPAAALTNVVAFDDEDLFIGSGLTLQKPSASIHSLQRVA